MGAPASAKKSATGGRARERPDKYVEIGERGRKTGIKAPPVQRGSDGFEAIDHFFNSSPTGTTVGYPTPRAPKSINRSVSSVRNASNVSLGSPLRRGGRSYEVEEEHERREEDPWANAGEFGDQDDDAAGFDDFGGGGEDEASDMDLADNHTRTPSRYSQHQKNSPSSSPRRNASTLSSKAAGKRRKVSSSPEAATDEDSEEEAEIVKNIVVGASRSGGSSAGLTNGAKDGEDDMDDMDDMGIVDEDAGMDFGGVDQEEEEEEAESPPPPPKNKGKGKASPPKKKVTKVSSAQLSKKRARNDEDEDPDGVRRSSRQRVQPVEYWRNERVIYKRRQSGLGIDRVVHIEKIEPESLANRHKNRRRGASAAARVKSEIPEDEDGVDDMTDPDGIVWNFEGEAEAVRRIAFTAKMMDPKPTFRNKFAFQKIFSELDYLAGGILQIPAGCEKPSKNARDNSYMFYCIEGSVSVQIHRSRFAIGPGGTFFVPRGNTYAISATSNRDVKLFFTQARRINVDVDGNAEPDVDPRLAEQGDEEQAQEEEAEEEEEDDD
ncbi:centromere protein C [Pseudohyphozyma bogoriensis]|nr:centromere protein C [Pseudohyphozyma bogoriensis]